jgi:hypothetical protein
MNKQSVEKMSWGFMLLIFSGFLLTSCEKEAVIDEAEPKSVSLPNISGYPIVETNQTTFYGNLTEIVAPVPGEAFYGQDASFSGNEPSYTDNGDGTITDNVTGLMWSQTPDLNGDGTVDADDKLSYSNALVGASSFGLNGYDNWRLPTIKELYSLIMFSGIDPMVESSSTGGLEPFINTDYFGFGYGDVSAGERIIDAQFATSTLYVSTTMNGAETMFGVNFADGRIKGYPTGPMMGQTEDKGFYVLYVRGNTDYGQNDFADNGEGTITDKATGLMWAQADNGEGLDWEGALLYAEDSKLAGYSDWRLPNAKELQSIVDYTRSPKTHNSPAIDPLFDCTQITNEAGALDYPYYWTGTTHYSAARQGTNAVYICFGRGLGEMNDVIMDVHGAGCQRSDPKEEMQGGPDAPQGDIVRSSNYVRLVRDASN